MKQRNIVLLIAGVIAALCNFNVATAQQFPPHPSDPGATALGSFWVTVDLSTGKGSSLAADDDDEKPCRVMFEVIFYRTSNNRTDYVVNTGSIRAVGDCAGVIDNIPTGQLFGMLSQVAVAQGVANGYTVCGPSCSTPTITKAYQSLCVTRTGSGNATHFESCDVAAWCEKEYAVCCPPGASGPSITLIGTTMTGSCGIGPNGTPCQTTCQ